jgi:hypothetical protein
VCCTLFEYQGRVPRPRTLYPDYENQKRVFPIRIREKRCHGADEAGERQGVRNEGEGAGETQMQLSEEAAELPISKLSKKIPQSLSYGQGASLSSHFSWILTISWIYKRLISFISMTDPYLLTPETIDRIEEGIPSISQDDLTLDKEMEPICSSYSVVYKAALDGKMVYNH